MPMDIRSFFGKPKPGGVGTAKKGNPPRVATDKSPAKKPTKVPPLPKNKNKKKEQQDASWVKSFDDTDEEDAKESMNKAEAAADHSAGKKRKAKRVVDKADEDVQEISPEAFFSTTTTSTTTTNKSSSVTKKAKSKESASPSASTSAIDDSEQELIPSPGRATRSSPRKAKTPPSSAGKKRVREESTKKDDGSDDDDSDDDADFVLVEKPKTPPKPKPKAKAKTTPTSSSKRAKALPSPKAAGHTATSVLEPTLELDAFHVDDAQVSECLQGITFCFTGILEGLHRDAAVDLIKILGGRVTTGVSGKTTYLVIGETLEDGRHYTEGKKFKVAQEKPQLRVVLGERKLYGLCHLYQERAKQDRGLSPTPASSTPANPAASKVTATTAAGASPDSATAKTPAATAAAKANPYTKKANPYAKKSNPYAKSASSTASGSAATAPAASNLYAKKSPYGNNDSGSTSKSVPTTTTTTLNQLWTDRYAPQTTRDILGNKDNVQKLTTWLQSWERTFNHSKAYNKTFSNPRGPWKAALLSGPPGIGKTTTATLVAKEAGRDLREFNASDARSKKALQNQLGDLTGSQSLGFVGLADGSKQAPKKLRCVIMDEVDGMGAGDRSGMAELIQMIKKSKVPIICICNDRQSQKMKSLLPYCMDLRFKRPTKSIMANRAVRIAELEGMQVERNAAEAIAESCGNDVRQVLNCMQMWAQKKDDTNGDTPSLTYKNLKDRESSINKDEILRVSLFDAARTILEGRRGLSGADAKAERNSLFRRTDAFFVDYSFTGLLVQQNYPRILQGPYAMVKRADDADAELTFLNRMHDAAASMSDYALVEHQIRTGDQNWSLLPTCAMMAVKTGYHAGGETGGSLPGYPEFTAWMGKNSSKGKKVRLLNELHHHMNFKISADSQQMRESYLPVLKDRFLMLLTSTDTNDKATEEAIQLMDEYGLSREDVVEKLDEFNVGTHKGGPQFSDLDSKQKAAFTRLYNQGSHKSQALVHEEYGAIAKKPKKSGKADKDPQDLDAIDEDVVEEDASDGEDEEAELKKLQEKLKRKGRKGGSVKPKAKGKKTKKK